MYGLDWQRLLQIRFATLPSAFECLEGLFLADMRYRYIGAGSETTGKEMISKPVRPVSVQSQSVKRCLGSMCWTRTLLMFHCLFCDTDLEILAETKSLVLHDVQTLTVAMKV